MGSLKIGRNDPCPCGSGKKYKKCCGLLGNITDISFDPFTRCSQLLASVKLKLDEYYGPRIKKMRRDMKDRFLRFTVQPVLPGENESFFSEWLWFAPQSGERPSLGFEYLQMHEEYMEKPLKDTLIAINNSYLSVYEVEKALHQYLEVKDIFSQQRTAVLLKEPWEVEISENPPLLLGRLVQFDQNHVFSGMVLISTNKSGEKAFLQNHVNFVSQLQNIDKTVFLRKRQEMLYGLFDHALKQVAVAFDHMEAAELQPDDREVLLTALKSDSDWSLTHQTGGYNWFSPTTDLTGYVRIAVGEGDLVWTAEVLEDIRKVRNTIRSIAPGLSTTVINNRFTDGLANSDHFNLWFLIIRDREAEKWLHTPHVELENKTPSDLLKDEEGRVQLQQMLDEYMADSTHEGQALLKYMQERVQAYGQL